MSQALRRSPARSTRRDHRDLINQLREKIGVMFGSAGDHTVGRA